MATTKNQISYGSKGDDVKELQTLLNSKGYSLDVDGSFGSETQAAVRDYQNKNKLQVDGIVGKNTWASLAPTTSTASGSSTSTTTKNTSASTTQNTAKPSGFTYDPYKESDTVAAAKAALQAQLNNKPGAYQPTYEQQINDTLNKILNREKFSYDLNGDALYQQYKDQYTTQGKQAMMDTMGQAAALTGGYGNSYAQNAGQQAYHGYLQQLNNKVPELYQLALDQYNREGDNLVNQYSLYSDRENEAYSKYRDSLNDYYTNLEYLTNQYQTARDTDYGRYADALNLAYQISRDQAADKQWQTEFDENLRRWNYENGLNPDGTPISTGNSGGGGGSRGSGSGSNNNSSGSTVGQSFMDSVIAASANSKLAKKDTDAVVNDIVKAGISNENEIFDYVDNMLNKNQISDKQAEEIYDKALRNAQARKMSSFGF